MKLSAIYNAWSDSTEWLQKSVGYIKDHVDLIIIVNQSKSYYGEPSTKKLPPIENAVIIDFDKWPSDNPREIQRAKRNAGLNLAIGYGCTHFLTIDCDELYIDFKELKSEYIASGSDGSHVNIETYVAKPNYRVSPPMGYKVPFIHKIYPDHKLGGRYPARVDDTRTYFCHTSVCLSKPMHHMSWVREDIEMKIRNSAAKQNRRNDAILRDVQHLLKHGPENYQSEYFRGRFFVETEKSLY